MTKYPENQHGFTLVELSVVLIIVGLLIGGILMGQELLETAQINRTIKQMQEYNTAVTQFQSMYKMLPGDMANPGTRLEGCTYSPCNVSGDEDGKIGATQSYSASTTYETNTMWHHLAADKLVTDIATTNTTLRLSPPTPIGGTFYIYHYNQAPNSRYAQGIYGHLWVLWDVSGTPTSSNTPMNVVQKMDEKIDDGKPWSGKVILGSDCGESFPTNAYLAGNTTPCLAQINSGF